jgi:hypothetical protein
MFVCRACTKRLLIPVRIRRAEIGKRWGSLGATAAADREARDRESRDQNSTAVALNGNVNQPSKRVQAHPKAVLEAELRWLPDPMKLAKRTLEMLRSEEHGKALELVQLASSKGMACTVSWNHLIDWDMRMGRVGEAWRGFNDVSDWVLS